MIIKFRATELRRLLANGILFAAPKKDMLPVLSVVRFDWWDDNMYAIATNRCVMSWEAANPVEADGRTPFSVSIDAAKQVIAMIPRTAFPAAVVEVHRDDDSGRTEFRFDGSAVTTNTGDLDREFPRVRQFATDHKTAARETVTLSPEFLVLLGKVQSEPKNCHARFEFATDRKPAKVTIGESFQAMIMPVRDGA